MFGWLVVNGFLHNDKFDEIPVLFQKAAENFLSVYGRCKTRK